MGCPPISEFTKHEAIKNVVRAFIQISESNCTPAYLPINRKFTQSHQWMYKKVCCLLWGRSLKPRWTERWCAIKQRKLKKDWSKAESKMAKKHRERIHPETIVTSSTDNIPYADIRNIKADQDPKGLRGNFSRIQGNQNGDLMLEWELKGKYFLFCK